MTTTLTRIPDVWRRAVAAEMRRVVDAQPLAVTRHARYHLGWEDPAGRPVDVPTGKLLRPTLTLSACQIVCGDWQPATPAAAAVELLHNFSLIHDDVEDGGTERHHRPTVWTLVGVPRAINAGDALFTLARLALGGLSEGGVDPARAIVAYRLFDDASLQLCEGQELDLAFESRLDVTVKDYLRMISGKTGALMGLALELGALCGRATPELRNAFRSLGGMLGVGFQMRDDILGVWGEQHATGKGADDLLRRKRGLPLVVAIETASGPEARELRSLLDQSDWQPDDAAALCNLFDRNGLRARTEAIVADQGRRLRRQLEALRSDLPDSPELDRLAALVEFAIQRDR